MGVEYLGADEVEDGRAEAAAKPANRGTSQQWMANLTTEILLDNCRRQLYSGSALVRMTASYLGSGEGTTPAAPHSGMDLLIVEPRFTPSLSA